MKDRIRYSEAFKLKVMEELRDAKWKSVQEAARAYGIAEMSVYNWMHKLGFEHLKGRLIYVKTRTELDWIKELEEQMLRLKQSLADEVLDHKIDVEFLKIACQRAGTSVEDLKIQPYDDTSSAGRSASLLRPRGPWRPWRWRAAR